MESRWYYDHLFVEDDEAYLIPRSYLYKVLADRGPFTDPDYPSSEDTIERLTKAKVLSVK